MEIAFLCKFHIGNVYLCVVVTFSKKVYLISLNMRMHTPVPNAHIDTHVTPANYHAGTHTDLYTYIHYIYIYMLRFPPVTRSRVTGARPCVEATPADT